MKCCFRYTHDSDVILQMGVEVSAESRGAVSIKVDVSIDHDSVKFGLHEGEDIENAWQFAFVKGTGLIRFYVGDMRHAFFRADCCVPGFRDNGGGDGGGLSIIDIDDDQRTRFF